MLSLAGVVIGFSISFLMKNRFSNESPDLVLPILNLKLF